ncbi:MAG: hypothetical protein WCE49_16765 [Terrimicrobiaceae bacterium]
MADDEDRRSGSEKESELVPRPPAEEDLVALCRILNKLGARYLVIGGYAIIHAGYPRFTGDLDILIDTAQENEAKVFEALRSLADRAADELDPGDVAKYTVVRVADEIVVDLMNPLPVSITRRHRRKSSSEKSATSKFPSPRPASFGA